MWPPDYFTAPCSTLTALHLSEKPPCTVSQPQLLEDFLRLVWEPSRRVATHQRKLMERKEGGRYGCDIPAWRVLWEPEAEHTGVLSRVCSRGPGAKLIPVTVSVCGVMIVQRRGAFSRTVPFSDEDIRTAIFHRKKRKTSRKWAREWNLWKINEPTETSRIFTEGNERHLFKLFLHTVRKPAAQDDS